LGALITAGKRAFFAWFWTGTHSRFAPRKPRKRGYYLTSWGKPIPKFQALRWSLVYKTAKNCLAYYGILG